MKKVLIIKGFIAASIIAVLGQLTSCQNEDGFTQESTVFSYSIIGEIHRLVAEQIGVNISTILIKRQIIVYTRFGLFIESELM